MTDDEGRDLPLNAAVPVMAERPVSTLAALWALADALLV